MQKITSKKVYAMWPGGGLLQNQFWKDIQDKLKNDKTYSNKYESGETKKNVVPTTGFGSRWRQINPGAGIGTGYEKEEEDQPAVSSGYNDGGQADSDEGGINNSKKLPEPYWEIDEYWSDLAIKNQGIDKNPRNKKPRSFRYVTNIRSLE